MSRRVISTHRGAPFVQQTSTSWQPVTGPAMRFGRTAYVVTPVTLHGPEAYRELTEHPESYAVIFTPDTIVSGSWLTDAEEGEHACDNHLQL
jgi:hypothetical protein